MTASISGDGLEQEPSIDGLLPGGHPQQGQKRVERG